MPLPDTATPAFRELIDVYKHTEIEFRSLRKITAAQWALESGWGTSKLAQNHLNYAGMKYRKALEAYATQVPYKAWDGLDGYCHFEDHGMFIAAFWARFDQTDLYAGWRNAAAIGPAAFLQKIGPTWVGGGPKEHKAYITKITLIAERRFHDIF